MPIVDAPRAGAVPNPTPPTGFAIELALGGHGELSNPIAVEFAPDGSVFVAQKNGIIKRFDGIGDPTPQTFADLRTEVFNYADKGMLGLEVDPLFTSTRPYVYAAYAYDAPPGEVAPYWGDACPDPPGPTTEGCATTARVVRFTDTGSYPAAAPTILIDGTNGSWCHQFPSHTVGHLEIGPDGMLYVSSGEGANYNLVDYGQLPAGSPTNPCDDPADEGGALRAQDARTSSDPQSLDGSILRVNPDTGAAPSDNPYAASADANRRRVIAYGMRNPYRFTFSIDGDHLYATDVGWTEWEEINRVDLTNTGASAVENFGWPCYEGPAFENSYRSAAIAVPLDVCLDLETDVTDPPDAPFISYNHTDDVITGDGCDGANGSAATGVAFYAGGDYPAQFDGAMFLADFARSCVWVVYPDGDLDPDWDDRQLFLDHGRFITDFETGPGGDLFWVNSGAGRIERVRHYAGNRPPVAVIGANVTSGPIPLSVNFDVNASYDADPGDGIASVAWDLDGDGAYDDSTSFTPNVVFDDPGRVIVGLRVTDQNGATDTDAISIDPAETPPVPLITGPASSVVNGVQIADDLAAVGDDISFAGVALDNQDGVVATSGYRWELSQQHCVAQGGCHAHLLQTFEGVASGTFAVPDHAYPTWLELTLFATDSADLTASQTLRIDPLTATLSVTSNPTGLRITVDDTTSRTPFNRTVVAGSAHSIAPIEPQEASGQIFAWQQWSDAGTRIHSFTVPAGGQSISGTFASTGPAPSAYDYRIASLDGRTEVFAKNRHRTEAQSLQTPPLGAAASTPSRDGFWRASTIGRVAASGDAKRYGDLLARQRTAPVVDLESTETGLGYWMLLADGSVYAFGDAEFRGQPTPGQVGLRAVAIGRSPSGRGYWVTDAAGHVFDYGDARWRGSLAQSIHAPVVDLAPMPDSQGYWLLTEHGVVAAFGTATNLGSKVTASRAVALLATPSGDGYWMLMATGAIWDFGDAPRYGRWTRGSRPITLF